MLNTRRKFHGRENQTVDQNCGSSQEMEQRPIDQNQTVDPNCGLTKNVDPNCGLSENVDPNGGQYQNVDLNNGTAQNDICEEEIESDLRKSKHVLLVPYIPGLSDRLRNVAKRYEMQMWFSYRGRVGDGFSTTYKDKAHFSKSRHAVYKAVCSCGHEYIGESERNLKVRVLEHESANSASSLSNHLKISKAHQLEPNRTVAITYEKHYLCRKMLESLYILHNPTALCNVGPSTEMSEMWFACEERIHTYVAQNV